MPPNETRLAPSPMRAEQLLEEHGLDTEWPIPLEALAEKLGYRCFFFRPSHGEGTELKNVSGAVNHTEKKIYVNAVESLVRQRFTLAHEIGHAYLHADEGNVIDYRKNILTGTDPKEVEANRFAANLLMPKRAFAMKWLDFDGKVSDLARYFAVSKEAAKIRIEQLGINNFF